MRTAKESIWGKLEPYKWLIGFYALTILAACFLYKQFEFDPIVLIVIGLIMALPLFGKQIPKWGTIALFVSTVGYCGYYLYHRYTVDQKGLATAEQNQENREILQAVLEMKDPGLEMLERAEALVNIEAGKAYVSGYDNFDTLMSAYEKIQEKKKMLKERMGKYQQDLPESNNRNVGYNSTEDNYEFRNIEMVGVKITSNGDSYYAKFTLEPWQRTKNIVLPPGYDFQIQREGSFVFYYDGRIDTCWKGKKYTMPSDIKVFSIGGVQGPGQTAVQITIVAKPKNQQPPEQPQANSRPVQPRPSNRSTRSNNFRSIQHIKLLNIKP